MKRVPSPCINICDLDRTGKWCLGCGRSVDEITGWLHADDVQRQTILDELPDRLMRLNGEGNL